MVGGWRREEWVLLLEESGSGGRGNIDSKTGLTALAVRPVRRSIPGFSVLASTTEASLVIDGVIGGGCRQYHPRRAAGRRWRTAHQSLEYRRRRRPRYPNDRDPGPPGAACEGKYGFGILQLRIQPVE